MEHQSHTSPELTIRIAFRTSTTQTAHLMLTGKLMKKSVSLLTLAFNECVIHKKDTILLDMSKVSAINSSVYKIMLDEIGRIDGKKVKVFLFGLNPGLTARFYHHAAKNKPKIYDSITECQKEIEFYEEYKTTHHSVPSSTATVEAQAVASVTQELIPASQSATVDVQSSLNNGTKKMPLAEKITSIISKYGPCSALKILSYLKSEEYEHTDINILQLNRLLTDMDLNTPEKRTRYYRSC
jgi:anti-anti-sigma regulatory factor